MSYRLLREQVCAVNKEISRSGLAILTWGNASGVDREAGVMAIKPSGVDYHLLRPEDIVLVSLVSGKVVDGNLRPSSDSPTHLELYRRFPALGGVVHTHSHYGTVFAQAGRAIPCLGTTHADNFYGTIPVTRPLTAEEVQHDYELNTGRVIVDHFRRANLDPAQVPGVLVTSHAPFAWGKTPERALESAVVLEAVARMALQTLQLAPDVQPIPQYLLDKHFLRKHGSGAYYGQK